MNQSNRTIQAFWVAAGTLSSLGLSIISSMVMARYLTKIDLGTFRQVAYVYGTLSVIFLAGLPNVYAYFLPRNSINTGKSIVNKVMIALLGLGAVFSFVLYFGGVYIAAVLENKALEEALKSFAILPIFIFPTLGIDGILATHAKTKLLAVYTIASRSLMLVMMLIPVVLWNGTHIDAIHGWATAGLFSFILAIWLQKTIYKSTKSEPTKITYSEILNYSLPLVFAGLSGILFKASDQFFISRYFGPEIFAEYSVGMMELPVVGMITAASTTVLLPLFSKMSHENINSIEIYSIWQSTIMKTAILVYPIIIYCLIFAPTLMELLYTSSYKNASNYFRINLIVNFFNIVIFYPIILAIGKTKLYSYAQLISAVLVWGFCYIAVNIYPEPEYVAATVVFVKIILIGFFVIYIANHFSIPITKLFPMRLLINIIMIIMLAGAIAFIMVNYVVTIGNPIMEIILELFVYYFSIHYIGKFCKIDFLMPIKPILAKINDKINGK